MGALDYTHAALADLRDDAVVTKQFADQKCSWDSKGAGVGLAPPLSTQRKCGDGKPSP